MKNENKVLSKMFFIRAALSKINSNIEMIEKEKEIQKYEIDRIKKQNAENIQTISNEHNLLKQRIIEEGKRKTEQITIEDSQLNNFYSLIGNLENYYSENKQSIPFLDVRGTKAREILSEIKEIKSIIASLDEIERKNAQRIREISVIPNEKLKNKKTSKLLKLIKIFKIFLLFSGITSLSAIVAFLFDKYILGGILLAFSFFISAFFLLSLNKTNSKYKISIKEQAEYEIQIEESKVKAEKLKEELDAQNEKIRDQIKEKRKEIEPLTRLLLQDLLTIAEDVRNKLLEKSYVINKAYDDISTQIKEIDVAYLEKQTNENNALADEINSIEEAAEKRIKMLEGESEILYSEAKNMGVDERDWKHIDVLIYLLETGRAESVKEALQLTDTMHRHSELLNTIHSATEYIGSTIRESMENISLAMENIAISIDFQARELRDSINENHVNTSNLVKKMINSQDLCNALLEKSNFSSEKLVENISHLRERRDYEYYITGI